MLDKRHSGESDDSPSRSISKTDLESHRSGSESALGGDTSSMSRAQTRTYLHSKLKQRN